jgi:hypothetical protein
MRDLVLKDTVSWMISNDWKDQLKAEYWLLKIRIYDLAHKMDTDDPEERSEVLWLNSTMVEYLKALEENAVSCGIIDYIMDLSCVKDRE